MQKLKTFVRSVIKSCSDPAYYKDILAAKPSFSWQYFLFFNFLLSVILAVGLMVPVALFDLESAADELAAVYPADLELVYDQGQLSINQELPYVVPLPVEATVPGEELPTALVTFTSNEMFLGVPNFDQYQSLAVITETTLYVQEDMDTGEIRSYNFDEFQVNERIEVTPATIQTIKQAALDIPFVKNKWYVPAIGAAVLVFVLPGMLWVRLVTLLIYSFIAWLLSRLFVKGLELSYGNVYKLSLHSITPVIIVSWILGAVGVFQLSGWLYLGAYLVWTLLVFNQLKSGPKPQSAKKKAPARKPAAKTVTKKKMSKKKSK